MVTPTLPPSANIPNKPSPKEPAAKPTERSSGMEDENMEITLETTEEHNDPKITVDDVCEDFKEETCYTK